MTEAEARHKPITYLQQYLGIREGSTQHKEILAVFNNSKLCTRYTMTTKDAWCATGVSAAFIATGLTAIFPCVECSCPNMISKAQAAGIWVESDAYVPETGDVIMYDWQDTGSGDNTGVADHVGIVESVTGSTIKVIECNKNDSVDYRLIAVNGRYIRGYITPNYTKAASGTSSAATTTAAKATTGGSKFNFSVSEVKNGSTGEDVKLLQRLLKSNACRGADGQPLTADGDCGPNTVAAIKKYQKKKKLSVDGIAGKNTWKSILLR